jgi:hypothetical protein
MLAAHLRYEHGWSWDALRRSFHAPWGALGSWREVRQSIESAGQKMGYAVEEATP